MSKPAPGELELVRGFVNTWDAEDRVDALAAPEALSAWLAERELLDPDAPPATPSDLDRALGVRDALRAMLRANHGDELDPAAPPALEAGARRARLAVRFGDDGVARVEPLGAGVDAALGRLLAVVARAQEEGTWRRLKVCPADDCQWAFYDTSRNRSAVWCSMEVCGNRAKVRTFRQRQREDSGS